MAEIPTFRWLASEILASRGAMSMWHNARTALSIGTKIMRLLHTMIRTGNLERSIEFYTKVLGMKLLRRNDYPAGKFTLAFVGYGDEASNAVIELTYNWGVESYSLGDGFGHLAIEVPDARAACDEVRRNGGTVVRDAAPMNHGTTVIAFLSDPDGYKIELIERTP